MQELLQHFSNFRNLSDLLPSVAPIYWLSPSLQVCIMLGLLGLCIICFYAIGSSPKGFTRNRTVAIIITHMLLSACELYYCSQSGFDITWFLDTDLMGWGWAIFNFSIFAVAIVVQYFTLLITLMLFCSSTAQSNIINSCLAYWYWGLFVGGILTMILEAFGVGDISWEPILKMVYFGVILILALVLLVWSFINGSFFKGILLALYYLVGGFALAIFGFELLRILFIVALFVLGFAILSGRGGSARGGSALYTIRDSVGRTIAEDCERTGANTYQDRYGNSYEA